MSKHPDLPHPEVERGLRYVESLSSLIAALGQEMYERASLLSVLIKHNGLTVDQSVRLIQSLGARADGLGTNSSKE